MIFLHDVTGESAVDAGSVDIVYADTLYGTGRMFSYNDALAITAFVACHAA
jgi:hypothetical protein